jgi:16S rRNA (uracil1498-N3)-methyltransferase
VTVERELREAVALVFVEDLERPQLTEADAHHLVEVLRVSPNESIAASDGGGAYRMCTLGGTEDLAAATGRSRRKGRSRARASSLRTVGPVKSEPAPVERVTVGFAIPKGDRAEWIVQKLTELGVDVIVPLLTDRTVVRLEADDLLRRGERYRRVGREAAAQCRRVRLPEIFDPTKLSTLPMDLATAAVLAEPGARPIPSGTTAILVGPEGGWSDAELARGFDTVEIAEHVLRAETAAVTSAVLLTAARTGTVALAPLLGEDPIVRENHGGAVGVQGGQRP